MKRAKAILADNWDNAYMSGFDFSCFIHDLLISENGYVCDTGNYETVNRICAEELMMKIKKHPIIWKLFFMIA